MMPFSQSETCDRGRGGGWGRRQVLWELRWQGSMCRAFVNVEC